MMCEASERAAFERWVESLPRRKEGDSPLALASILSGLDLNVAWHIWQAARAARGGDAEAMREACAAICDRHAALMRKCSQEDEEAKHRLLAYRMVAEKIRALPAPPPVDAEEVGRAEEARCVRVIVERLNLYAGDEPLDPDDVDGVDALAEMLAQAVPAEVRAVLDRVRPRISLIVAHWAKDADEALLRDIDALLARLGGGE